MYSCVCDIFFLLICFLDDSFTVEEKSGDESYTYVFQLCGDAEGVPGAGLIQVNSKKTKKPTVIGMYNATQAIGGSKYLQNNMTL